MANGNSNAAADCDSDAMANGDSAADRDPCE